MSGAQLEERHQQTIQVILQQYPSVKRAMIFGSRAVGKSDRGSDIDLALFGEIDEQTLGLIRSDLEDTTIPFFFDVLIYAAITNDALREHIDTHGTVVFERGSGMHGLQRE